MQFFMDFQQFLRVNKKLIFNIHVVDGDFVLIINFFESMLFQLQ